MIKFIKCILAVQKKSLCSCRKNANFCFNPQPTIPFKDSAFENTMKIYLDDETASFQMSEIFSVEDI